MPNPHRRTAGGLFVAALAALLAASGCGGNSLTPASYDPDELALIRVEPSDGESSVPRNRVVRLIFNTSVLPASVHDQSLRVRSGGTFQTRPEGTFLIAGNIVEFDPTVTSTGTSNAIGFEAGAQVLVEVPLYFPQAGLPANNFLQNVEGNPITVAAGDAIISFTTGCAWADPTPGPPGVLGLEFTPGPNSAGQVPSGAAVTVIFSEPIDPESLVLGSNIFLTNNTATSPEFQQDVPSRIFFDGSLTRYTFVPVFGFGQGPFSVLVNFIDPDAPETFDPARLPRDLGGNGLQNFTFFQTFDTQFDPVVRNVGLIREDFTQTTQRDASATTAVWGTDAAVPFALIAAPVTSRVQNVDIAEITAAGGVGISCVSSTLLVGPDLPFPTTWPPSSQGRRVQNVFRSAELGDSGTIIRAGWGPAGDVTTASTYERVLVRMGHKRAGTNLTNGGFQAEFDVDGFVTLADARYSVSQSSDVNGDGVPDNGFVDWPRFDNFFEYDGVDDLLVEIQSTEGTATQLSRYFVAAPTACSCGAVFNGSAACATNASIGIRSKEAVFGSEVVDPAMWNAGLANPSPASYTMQFELARLRSAGTSLFYDSGAESPDYLDPILGPLVQPCGASVALRWSGSMDGIVEDVPFSPNIHAVDGFRFVRFEAVLRSNLFTGSRARILVLEIPFLVPQ